jgi:metal-sulfur cluster biosynthetic enzyme
VSAVSEALGAIEPVSDCRVELSADAAAALAGTLRAQVEAARAECARVHNAPRCMNAYDVATDVRRAMDGAKNE